MNPGPGTDADVVVVGSGGAGLLAACVAADAGRSVLVLERSPLLGGTTAVSGGMIWAPGNPLMASVGVTDSRPDALRYLDHVTEGTVERWRLEQFVDVAPRMVGYLLDRTPVRLFPIDRPDYHPDWPGARPAGRTLDNRPFPTAGRPGLAARTRTGPHFAALTYDERHRLRWPGSGAAELAAGRSADGVLTVGAALVAALVGACDDRGVRLRTGQRARGLIVDRGRVVGVRVETAGGGLTYRASAGVVLASGGFEWNGTLRRAYLSDPAARPVSPPWNDGDGLLMAVERGAAVAAMPQAWWAPTVSAPQVRYDGRPLARHLVDERCLPGSILVNRRGRRFVNEAVNYHDLTKALAVFDPTRHEYPNLPAWLVFDGRFRSAYPVAGLPPSAPVPAWYARADSLAELAKLIDVDRAGLEATVVAFNGDARGGTDRMFGRGGNAHDRYYGDERRPGNPCLAALDEAPFYAIEVRPGMLGTKGGLVTDRAGQVLRHDGTPIPGLFACGNVAASLMGPGYPGSGGTLGPALVGGYLCGRAAGGGGDEP